MGKHLVVLIHGLWGNYKHLNSLRESLKKRLSGEGCIFYSSRHSALLKTLDGIEILGYRTLIEICQFIKYHEKKCKKEDIIDKISIIGYSLGGLIARFVIGKLYTDCKDIFDRIEPVMYLTVATPHVGVKFFNPHNTVLKSVLNVVLRLLGTTVLGKSGKQLFITNDSNRILVDLTENEFIEGLAKFKYRIVVANVKNDRTVAFYTSFITNCDPFILSKNVLQFTFDNTVPHTDCIKGPPKIVEMNKLNKLMYFQSTETSRSFKKILLRIPFILLAILVFLPIAFIANVSGTIYRSFMTRKYRKIIKDGVAPDHVKSRISIDDKVRAFMETVYEDVLAPDDNDSTVEDDVNSSSEMNQSFESSDNCQTWDEFVQQYSTNWMQNGDAKSEVDHFETKFPALTLDSNRKNIIKNLNQLSWIKIPIYVKALNAHRSVIARNGLKGEVAGGVAAVEFTSELIKHLLKQ